MKHQTIAHHRAGDRRPNRRHHLRGVVVGTLAAAAVAISLAPGSYAATSEDLSFAGPDPYNCANHPDLCPTPPPDPCPNDPKGCPPPEPECPEVHDGLGDHEQKDSPVDCPPPPEINCKTVSPPRGARALLRGAPVRARALRVQRPLPAGEERLQAHEEQPGPQDPAAAQLHRLSPVRKLLRGQTEQPRRPGGLMTAGTSLRRAVP